MIFQQKILTSEQQMLPSPYQANPIDSKKNPEAAIVSILLYGCTTWMLTKRLEKKLDGKYTRMVQAILNKS